MASPATYEETAQLPTAALSALLHEGRGAQRIWAAWALALRRGGEARPELVQQAHREPEPGVRRHLLGVLAGYGERALLGVVAQEEPDVYVRAAAAQALARILTPGDEASLAVLARCLTRDPAAEVRLATLLHLPAEPSPRLEAAVDAATADPDAEVRGAAAQKRLAWAGPAGHLPPVLRARAVEEPEPALRSLLQREWCLREGGEPLLCALGDAPPERLVPALRLCAEQGCHLSWAALAPLARRGDPRLDVWLAPLLRPHAAQAARVWLSQVALRHEEAPDDYDSAKAAAAREALERLLPQLEGQAPHGFDPEERAVLVRLQRALARTERELREAWTKDPEEYPHLDPNVPPELAALRALTRILQGATRKP